MTHKLAILYERIRWEEKAIIEESRKIGLNLEPINIYEVKFEVHLDSNHLEHDVYLQRTISYFKGLYSTALLEHLGKKVVNSFETSLICGNKLLTSLKLVESGIPTPRTVIAFSQEEALKAVEELGYPAILKPIHGSWGRLVAPLKDPLSTKAILEAREMLHPIHQIYYIQEMVKRPPRDIRSFVIGDEVAAAIYRIAPQNEWRTNTSRGGKAVKCEISEELEELSLKVSEAFGGGILGIDLMESPNGLLVHEVNHVIEFRNTVPVTGVNIPELILKYLINLVRR